MSSPVSEFVISSKDYDAVVANISSHFIKNALDEITPTEPFHSKLISAELAQHSFLEQFNALLYDKKKLFKDILRKMKYENRLAYDSINEVFWPEDPRLSGMIINPEAVDESKLIDSWDIHNIPRVNSFTLDELKDIPNFSDLPRLIPLFNAIVLRKLNRAQPYVVDNLKAMLNDTDSTAGRALELKHFNNKKEVEVVYKAVVEALKLNPELSYDKDTYTQAKQTKPSEVFWLAATVSPEVKAAAIKELNMASDAKSPRSRPEAIPNKFYETPMYLAIVNRLAPYFAGKALEVIEQKAPVEKEQEEEKGHEPSQGRVEPQLEQNLQTLQQTKLKQPRQQHIYPISVILDTLRSGKDIVTTVVCKETNNPVSKIVSVSDLVEFHHVDVIQLLYDVTRAMRQLRVITFNSVRGRLELGYFSGKPPGIDGSLPKPVAHKMALLLPVESSIHATFADSNQKEVEVNPQQVQTQQQEQFMKPQLTVITQQTVAQPVAVTTTTPKFVSKLKSPQHDVMPTTNMVGAAGVGNRQQGNFPCQQQQQRQQQFSIYGQQQQLVHNYHNNTTSNNISNNINTNSAIHNNYNSFAQQNKSFTNQTAISPKSAVDRSPPQQYYRHVEPPQEYARRQEYAHVTQPPSQEYFDTYRQEYERVSQPAYSSHSSVGSQQQEYGSRFQEYGFVTPPTVPQRSSQQLRAPPVFPQWQQQALSQEYRPRQEQEYRPRQEQEYHRQSNTTAAHWSQTKQRVEPEQQQYSFQYQQQQQQLKPTRMQQKQQNVMDENGWSSFEHRHEPHIQEYTLF